MSLLTELNGELLTESGLTLLAEVETESGSPVSGSVNLKAKATIKLVAHAVLSSIKMFTLISIKSKGAIGLTGKGLLHVMKSLKAKAALRLLARNGTAQPPSGIGMQMKIITDPYRPELILDQYLLIWFNGHPSQCRISLKIDDGAEFQPAFTWQNPGVTGPALIRIDSAAIAGDGKNHLIKVSVSQAVGNRTSTSGTFSDYAKIPNVRTTAQPEWCGATTLRQGETIRSGPYNWVYGHVPDLTRIEWRHTGAVQIMAKIPVRTKLANGAWGWKTSVVTLGYADHDETTFVAQDVGLLIGWQNGALQDVLFGVAAIQNGTFGPVTWASAPVKIREVHPQPQEAITNPDELAGTLRRVTGRLKIETYPDTFNLEVRARVLTHLGALPTNGNAIIDQAVLSLFFALKNRIRQGGSVTLDDLGRFEARWNEARTVRSVGFVASPGFVEGTKAGYLLTDAQAKALKP